MATPVIYNKVGIQGWRTGRIQALQMAITNGETITAWSATGLPPGVAIDSTTGLIAGRPTWPGVFPVTVSATNGSAQTGTLDMHFGVTGAHGLADVGDDFTVPIRVHAVSGAINFLETDPATVYEYEQAALAAAAEGAKEADLLLAQAKARFTINERRPFLIGFERDLTLQEVALVSLQVNVREAFTEDGITISESVIDTIGSGYDVQYRVMCAFTNAEFSSILEKYLKQRRQSAPLLLQIVAGVADARGIYDETETASLSGSNTLDEDDTLSFTGLQKITEEVTYALNVSVAVNGRTNQSVTLAEHEITVAYNSETEVFDVTSSSEPSGTGATEGIRWKGTFSIDSIDGTADGFDVVTNYASDKSVSESVIEIPLYAMQLNGTEDGFIEDSFTQEEIDLQNAAGGSIGTLTIYDEDSFASVMASFNSELSETTAIEIFVTGGIPYLRYLSTSACAKMEISAGALLTEEVVSNSVTGTITGRAEREVDTTDQTIKSAIVPIRLDPELV